MSLLDYRKLPAWLRLMRPEQWTKNSVVMVAFFFAYWDSKQAISKHSLKMFFIAIAAAVVFCLVSSAVYAFNDCKDRVADRLHPVKKFRPVASGEISPKTALALALALALFSCTAAYVLDASFFGIAATYLVLQFIYSCYLKHVPLLDVFMIAVGFVLRAVAGAAVLHAAVSPWFLLCTFLLALFLALCKRRQEKVTRKEHEQRKTLRSYSKEFLDQLITISAAATIVSYSLYTLSSATIAKFGTSNLGLTIPFVIFGVFRYLFLVYNSNEGERPERTLFTDPTMIITVLLYLIASALIFVFR